VGDLLYAEADYWSPLPAMYHDSWLLSRSVGGSAFVAAGCHAVDAIRWLGGDIVSVSARGARPRMLAALEYEPVVVATVTFANGAVGKLSTVLEGDTPHIFNVRLFGTGGSIQNNQIFSSARYPGATEYLEVPTTPPDRPEGQHPYAAQLEHFVECIDTDRESHASIHDAWKSMAVCFAIDRSLADGCMEVAVDSILRSESRSTTPGSSQGQPNVST
jgi:predicted dehydrogenase